MHNQTKITPRNELKISKNTKNEQVLKALDALYVSNTNPIQDRIDIWLKYKLNAGYKLNSTLKLIEFYIQIKDFASDDIIIPFSDYSKISCDENGNYINLNLSNWEADRTYKIEFKVTIDGNTQYFDNDITFRIVKN